MRLRLLPTLVLACCLLPATAAARHPDPLRADSLVTAGAGGERTIRLTVSPGRVLAGTRTSFRFRATARTSDAIAPPLTCDARRIRASQPRARRGATRTCASRHRVVPVRGAVVRFAGASARTDSRGYATITRTLPRAGVVTARATRAGFAPGRARVRALRTLGLTG